MLSGNEVRMLYKTARCTLFRRIYTIISIENKQSLEVTPGCFITI